MGMPYRARVNERTLLNLPGFHGGAFVFVYVEDTSERALGDADTVDFEHVHNFEPRVELEIADCSRRIELELDIDTPQGRANSLHKPDTLVAAINTLRACLVEEFDHYDRRERELEELRQ
ncbi:MAG: hypothetical protein U0R50_07700 [Gaiellales bacterium]